MKKRPGLAYFFIKKYVGNWPLQIHSNFSNSFEACPIRIVPVVLILFMSAEKILCHHKHLLHFTHSSFC